MIHKKFEKELYKISGNVLISQEFKLVSDELKFADFVGTESQLMTERRRINVIAEERCVAKKAAQEEQMQSIMDEFMMALYNEYSNEGLDAQICGVIFKKAVADTRSNIGDDALMFNLDSVEIRFVDNLKMVEEIACLM